MALIRIVQMRRILNRQWMLIHLGNISMKTMQQLHGKQLIRKQKKKL